jgi:GTP cyclohydrolase I
MPVRFGCPFDSRRLTLQLVETEASPSALRRLRPENQDPIAHHIEAIMRHVGEDVRRPGLADTPKRYAAAMRFLADGYAATLDEVVGNGVFAAEGDGVVVVRDVEFFSLCEHHVLPFFGRVHVAYMPGERIIGLSKIPRIVDLYARRLQVQERITEQVADALVDVLAPRGVIVIAEARHMCMAMRGVQKQHSVTATRALRGACANDPQIRADVLAMIEKSTPSVL